MPAPLASPPPESRSTPLESAERRGGFDAYGVASVLKNLLPTLAVYAAVPLLADRSVVLAVFLAPLAGLLLYRLTIVMHDCGHGTLFTARQANSAVGMFLGAVTGISFARFRARHWEHHKSYGNKNDPQGFHYYDIARMTNGAFVRHLLKPLLGLNLREVFAESYLHPANLVRASSSEWAILVAVQIALATLITAAGRHPFAVLLPPLSAVTFGLFFSQLRGIAEHGVRDAADPRSFVRSHRADWLGRLLLYDLHFNLHEEHHRRPQIPSRLLPALVREAQDRSAEERATMWQTLRGMLR